MNFIHKLIALEKAIAAEKGDLVLFAVVQRADGTGLWDLLLSASWFGTNEKEMLDFLVSKIKNTLTPQEMVLLSRIILWPPADPRVQQILQLVQQFVNQSVNHGHVELSSWTLSSMPVSHAHIITATAPQGSLSFSQHPAATGEPGTIRVFDSSLHNNS